MIYRLGWLTGGLVALAIVGGAAGVALHRSPAQARQELFAEGSVPLATDSPVRVPNDAGWIPVPDEPQEPAKQTDKAADHGQPKERFTCGRIRAMQKP